MTEEQHLSAADETTTSPWAELDQYFAEAFGPWRYGQGAPFFASAAGSPRGLRPARTDVTDTGTSFRVVVEVPGIPKEQLDIRLKGTTVELRGELSRETEAPEHAPLYRERRHAGFFRTVELPEPFVAGSATAKVENGLLVLELPKEHPTTEPAELRVPVQ